MIAPAELTLADVMKAIKRDPARKGTFTFATLAVYLDVSETTVRRIAKQPGFPPQRIFQTDENGKAVKLFVKADIDKRLQSAPISRAS